MALLGSSASSPAFCGVVSVFSLADSGTGAASNCLPDALKLLVEARNWRARPPLALNRSADMADFV
jgi:hypothetical protein